MTQPKNMFWLVIAKYLKNNSLNFLTIKNLVRHNAWKSLLDNRDLLKKGLKWIREMKITLICGIIIEKIIVQ